MAGKMKRDVQFNIGSASGVSAREIQKSGEAAKPAAGVHGVLAELVDFPTAKKFKVFLSEARESPKTGLERANEIRQVLQALNDFVETKRPEYGAIGKIVDGIFSVYGHEAPIRIASSLVNGETPIEGSRLLFLMCVCSRNDEAAKNAFVELKVVFADCKNSVSSQSFEEVAGIVRDNAKSKRVSEIAGDALSSGRFLGSAHVVRVN